MAEQVSIGSVISGTLRAEDLITAFANELRWLDPSPGSSYAIGVLADVEAWEEGKLPKSEAPAIVDALIDALNNFAPPYCYFGAHPDDGADFGWWVDWDALEMAKRDGYVYATEEPPEFLLHVNDHGNATLYRVTVEEVWSVV